MADESVLELISDLCHHQLKSHPRVSLLKPAIPHRSLHRRLKIKAYNALFSSLKGPHVTLLPSRENAHRSQFGVIDHLHCAVYELRKSKRYDDGNRLEALVNSFSSAKVKADTESVCLFLLCMKGTGPEKYETHQAGRFGKIPVVHPDKNAPSILPGDILCYGDTSIYNANISQWFMFYPPETFELMPIPEQSSGSEEKNIAAEIFSMTPGKGVRASNFFTAPETLACKMTKQQNLFGGLVQSSVDCVNVRLDIPELSEDLPPQIHAPKRLLLDEEDEGFAEKLSHSSSQGNSCIESDSGLFMSDASPSAQREEDLWDKALKLVPSKHYVWENVGCTPHVTEKPYASEAGLEAFDKILWKFSHSLTILHPDLNIPNDHEISMGSLVTDIKKLLLGLPSETFPFSCEAECFTFREGTFISGMSSDGLLKATADLVECGSQYRLLSLFSKPQVMDSSPSGGLIFQAFAAALREYLQLYHAAVLSLPKDRTLMQIKFLLFSIMQQINFLANMCKCTKQCPKILNPAQAETSHEFPTGIKLLSYLYEVAMDSSSSNMYPLLLAFLKASCKPYLVSISDWVFHGSCRDIYEEFMIKVKPVFLMYRDKHFWTRGYTLVEQDERDHSPVFLEELANDLFVCGKTLNLLRLCDDGHFLFTTDQALPSVEIAYSKQELASMETQASIYLSRMFAVARQHTRTVKQMEERTLKAKEELVIQARRIAQEEQNRFEERRKEMRRREDEKKKALLAEYKEQMHKDLRRRALEKENEREEDEERLKQAMKIEAVGTVVDEKLERMAREELIQYYEQLSAQAALREEKALWRVRRLRLNAKRAEFLRSDMAQVLGDLQKFDLSQASHGSDTDHTNSDLHLTSNQDTSVVAFEVASQSKVSADKNIGVRQSLESSTFMSQVQDLPKWAQEKPGLTKDEALLNEMPSQAMSDPSLTRKNILFDPLIPSENTAGQPSVPLVDGTADDGVAVVNSELNKESISGSDREKLIADLSEEQRKVQSILLKRGIDIGDEADPLIQNLPLIKTSVKLVADKHVATQSTHSDDGFTSSVKLVDGTGAVVESESKEEGLHIKMIPDHHASVETSGEAAPKKHIRFVSDQSVTKESHIVEERPKVTKMIEGKHVSDLSSPDDLETKPHLRFLLGQYANKESDPADLRVVKPSIHGHVSEVSTQEKDFSVPRLGKSSHMHANKETAVFDADYYGFQTKPCRRQKVKGYDVNQQSEEYISRPNIKLQEKHVSMQSVHIDVDEIRLQKFKERNVLGHASDSTVEKLLYGGKFGSRAQVEEEKEEPVPQSVIELVMNINREPFQDSWDFNKMPDAASLLSEQKREEEIVCPLTLYKARLGEESDVQNYVSLPAMLKKCVTAPLMAQIQLVNDSIINYFMVDLKLKDHFEALRHYLFMEDGEFSHSLSSQLFEKLASSRSTQTVLNPVFLNSALSKAIQASLHQSTNAQKLSFILKFHPHALNQNLDALDCLLLAYKVDWPLNIVITEGCLVKYATVFSFLLQLKRTAWTLQDVWQRMKRDALINDVKTSDQLRRLHLYRHEMQHLVQVMQSYITNQVIQGTWHRFMLSLERDACSVDSLHHCHSLYLEDCMARSLVDKRAEPVMKIIQSIFSLTLKFRTQLISHVWVRDSAEGDLTHPLFEQMCDTYKSFNEYSRFLYKVLSKQVKKRYQSHLADLLLRLNFNQ